MAEDVAIYLLRYWTKAIGTQASAPQTFPLFTRAVGELPRPMFSKVAAIMLLAAHATETQLSESLHQNLIKAVDSSSE